MRLLWVMLQLTIELIYLVILTGCNHYLEPDACWNQRQAEECVQTTSSFDAQGASDVARLRIE